MVTRLELKKKPFVANVPSVMTSELLLESQDLVFIVRRLLLAAGLSERSPESADSASLGRDELQQRKKYKSRVSHRGLLRSKATMDTGTLLPSPHGLFLQAWVASTRHWRP